MQVRKLTRNNQVTVPKTVRNELDLEEGDYVEFEIEEGKVLVKKFEGDRETLQLGKGKDDDSLEESIGVGDWQCR